MPFVSVSTVRGILDRTQKQALLQRITDLMVEIEGQGNPDFRKTVWVRIEEDEPANWTLGGVMLNEEGIAASFGAIGADGKRSARVVA